MRKTIFWATWINTEMTLKEKKLGGRKLIFTKQLLCALRKEAPRVDKGMEASNFV